MDNSTAIRCVASLGVGLAVSTGDAIGVTAAIAMPPLAMWQRTRRGAYESAFCYYAGAIWPVIPAARNFFGPSVSLPAGITAWLTASVLMAVPWSLAWSARRVQVVWRVPVALLGAVIPPLGLIGWASPLTTAGFLFPGTAWLGLFAVVLLCAGLCTKASVFYTALAAVILGMSAHLNYPGDPLPPAGWEALNTHFGAIAHGPADLIHEYTVAQWFKDKARCSHARVLIFPEMVVPQWTAATDFFWQPTLANLSASGKTILVGAGFPGSPRHPITSTAALGSYDFGAAIAALRGAKSQVRVHAGGTDSTDSYRNVVVIRGMQTGTFVQRVPVPFGMWHPFSVGGVPLNLSGPGVIRVVNQRTAILICYEQLLTWPFLASLSARPTVIVAIANDYWVERTPIPRYQATASKAWGRLFGIPVMSAVNR